jgi:hypothetical protein
MREERVTVRQDTTQGELVSQLITQFQAGAGEWAVTTEDEAHTRQDFRIEPNWRYTLEQQRRPTIRVTMQHRRQDHVCEVPVGTTEEGMKQLLVRGFQADIAKRWQVISRTPMHREDPYELKKGWTYELVEFVPPAAQESFRVLANTRLNGRRDDIEIETGWSEAQVHEACQQNWLEELREASDGRVPTTKLVTLDGNMQRVAFVAREGWTYEVKIKPQTPQWVSDRRLRESSPPSSPHELVLVGLQLEDGPRVERKVKQSLSEHGLKLEMWELSDYPQGPLYLHIRGERDELETTFKISWQWTYTLRRRPMETLRNQQKQQRVDGETGDPASATRMMREAQSLSKSTGAGTSKAKMNAQGATQVTQTKHAEVTRHVTVWCGRKTTNLTVRESMKKGDLIEWIVKELGEPQGSYTMEVWNTRGVLVPEYRVMEGWSYKIYRTSPPGTQEAADQALRKRGNESRPVLNRSSASAWHEEERNRTEARTADSGTGGTSRKSVGLSPRLG